MDWLRSTRIALAAALFPELRELSQEDLSARRRRSSNEKIDRIVDGQYVLGEEEKTAVPGVATRCADDPIDVLPLALCLAPRAARSAVISQGGRCALFAVPHALLRCRDGGRVSAAGTRGAGPFPPIAAIAPFRRSALTEETRRFRVSPIGPS